MADIDYDKLQQVLETAFAKSGLAGTSEESRQRREQNNQIRENVRRLRDLRENLGRSSDNFSTLLKIMGRQKAQITDNAKEIEDVTRAIRDETNTRNRGVLEARRAALEQQQRQSMISAGIFSTVDVLKTAVTSMTDNLASAIGQFVRGLQGRGSAFGLASTLMTGAVTAAGAGLQALGGGLATAGTALTAFAKAPWARGIGVLLAGIGLGLGTVSDAATKLAKFGIEVLNAEIEKTIESFRTAGTVGALFGGGLTELRATASAAGLTIEQFSSVLRNSADAIVQSGMGMSEGARMIGRVNQVLIRSGVQDKLLKLGFGFEEQSELIAQVSADMRRMGNRVTDQEVAQQTERYAENLRLIANITGQDAKTKMAQVREQNNVLAFQQKLAEMSPQQQQEISAAMASMTEMEKKALRERVIFNGVVRDKDAAIYESQFAGAREKGEEIYRLLQNGELTASRTIALNSQYNNTIRQSILSQEALGQAAYAGSQVLQGAARGGVELLDQASRQTAEAARRGVSDIRDAGAAADPLTNSYVAAEKAAQSLRIGIQDRLLPLMERYAEVTVAILSTIDKMLKELPIGAKEQKSAVSDVAKKGTEGVGLIGGGILGGLAGRALTAKLIGGAAGRMAGGLLGSIIPIGGTVAGTIGGGLLGEYLGSILGDMIFGGGKALGGQVVPGKVYLVGEKGPELFIPHGSGSITPNNMIMEYTDPKLREVGLASPDSMIKQPAEPKPREVGLASPDSMIKQPAEPKPREVGLASPDSMIKQPAEPKPREVGLASPDSMIKQPAEPKPREVGLVSPDSMIKQPAEPKPREVELTSPDSMIKQLAELSRIPSNQLLEASSKLNVALTELKNILQTFGSNSNLDLMLSELKNIMQEQLLINKQLLVSQRENIDVQRDMRSINQQILYATG